MVEQKAFPNELEVISVAEREVYFNDRLRDAVQYAYQKAPSTKQIMEKAVVRPEDIQSIKDLEKLPIIRKNDILELQKSKPPYGGFLTIPLEEVEYIFISPGPMYEPHFFPKRFKGFAKSFYTAGFRKGDIVMNSFAYHMSPAGVSFHEVLKDCGAIPIPMGTGNTESQIQTMYDLRVTGFVGTPSFLISLIKRAEEMGYNFRRDFALQRAWFTGEMVPASLRETLEKGYEISTSQAYAVTELGDALAYECEQKSGMHFVNEHIIEIVDPQNGKQLEAGQTGEIVATPIFDRAWGLIRFGTGDLSSYVAEPCSCGRTSNRLTGIIGRIGDAVKVRGMFVVAKEAEKVFNSFNEISKCQIVVGREGQRDTTYLKVELRDEDIDKDDLAERLTRRFQEGCRVKTDRIVFEERGVIPEEYKTLVDERVWK